jgi:tRNA (guanine37-N1)-methyltransferase
MRSLCARIPKVKGNSVRKKLNAAQLINDNLRIKHNDRFLFIPLHTLPPENWLQTIDEPELKLVEDDFEKLPERVSDYRANLNLPKNLLDLLPSSYDIIGQIAVLKLNDKLHDHAGEIGEAIIKTYKNVKTVALDAGVKGNLRIRQLTVVAGEMNTITIHKEYGIRLKLDIAKVYFSPRLGGEHYRVSELVKPGEEVLDMFAGIGPFSIMIAKHTQAQSVFSIDLNKDAIEYLIKNIDLNKVSNIFPMEGDVSDMIKWIPKVDRIIMNLPHNARDYLPQAFAVIKPKGIIHLHDIIRLQALEEQIKQFKTMVASHGFKVKNISEFNLGSYSPALYHICFDMQVELNH